jgi:hypothetical protein
MKKSMLPSILWGAFVFYLTLKPKGDSHLVLPPFIEALHPDKWVHFLLWGIWYYSYYHFNKATAFSQLGRIGIPITLICMGALVEIFQHYMQWGRTGDIYDFFADALGVLVAFWSVYRK